MPSGDTVAYSARWNPETIGVSGLSRYTVHRCGDHGAVAAVSLSWTSPPGYTMGVIQNHTSSARPIRCCTSR